MVNAIPDGFNTVSCYLVVPNAKEALDFYQKAFGAEIVLRLPGPGGENTTMHSEIKIGNSMVMITDENPQWNLKSPKTLGGTPASLHVYVENCDDVFQQAVTAGCTAMMPISDTFWGDRYGKVVDPFGHEWGIATHVEDVPPAELETRAIQFAKEMCDG